MRISRFFALLLAGLLLFSALPAALAQGNPVGQYAVILTGDLKRGDAGDAVVSLRRRLSTLGYFYGDPVGAYDEATEKAVASFETYLNDRQLSSALTALLGGDVAPAKPTIVNVDGQADTYVLESLYAVTNGCFWQEARLGDTGDEVVRLQNRLCTLGYLSGNRDGNFGAQTRVGVRAFQYLAGLREDGIADEATQTLLFSDDAPSAPYKALCFGDKGADVVKLQRLLMKLGFTEATLADGDYGLVTKTAVTNLQSYFKDKGVKLGSTRYAALEKELGIAYPIPVGDGVSADTAAADAPEPGKTLSISGEAVAYNGEDPYDISVNGDMDSLLMEYISTADTVGMLGSLKKDDWNDEVKRVQRRLYSLEYLFTKADGIYGKGTESAVTEFQKRNGLAQTGKCDSQTLAVIFSESARIGLRKYKLIVSVDEQKVYAYTYDDNDEYTVLVKTMTCSSGTRSTPTPLGTFTNTGRGARWHQFTKYQSWAQYAFYIDGDILFHSVLYNSDNEDSLIRSSVRALGRRASHGCVRLAVEDAKWIWNNCEDHTTVVVK